MSCPIIEEKDSEVELMDESNYSMNKAMGCRIVQEKDSEVELIDEK